MGTKMRHLKGEKYYKCVRCGNEEWVRFASQMSGNIGKKLCMKCGEDDYVKEQMEIYAPMRNMPFWWKIKKALGFKVPKVIY